MRVLAGIIVIAVIMGWSVMMAKGRHGGEQQLVLTKAAWMSGERVPGPNAKMLQPHQDAPAQDFTPPLPITSRNLFNCRSGKFDCDEDICVWACEVKKDEPDTTYPLAPDQENVLPPFDDGEGEPLTEEEDKDFGGDYVPSPDMKPLPFTHSDSPSKCEPDEDGRFDCPQDL